jgi:secretion/DNA translocation related TadE-like protein
VSNGERGSVTVLLAGAIFAGLVMGIVIAGTGQVLAARFQASTAADSAALAAAPATFRGDPAAEARLFAEANGAHLLSCDCRHDPTWSPRTVETLVEVTVNVLGLGPRTIRAKGRAEYVPVPSGRIGRTLREHRSQQPDSPLLGERLVVVAALR